MKQKEIEAKVKAIVVKIQDPSKEGLIDCKSATLKDLGADSLKIAQILIEIEQSFQIEIPDEKLNAATFHSVNSIVCVVSDLLSNVE